MTSAARIVQLEFGRFVHPVYREQLHAVPAGWRYVARHPALSDATTPTKRIVESAAPLAAARELAEHLAIRALSEAGYVHSIRAPRGGPGSLIHSAERLLRDSPLPYVVDFEHAELFTLYQRCALERPWARAKLERLVLDERLRFLLGWSETACRSMLAVLGPEAGRGAAPKLRVVSPAIRAVAERPRSRPTGPLRILFIGTAFYEKGAVEAIAAVRELRRTHDVTLDLVSYTPSPVRERTRAETWLTLHEPGGHDVVQRRYEQADLLLFPSHMDTFGYVVLEAMARGLPVLAPRHLALTETVREGVTGLLFEPEQMLYGADTRIRFRHVLPPPRAYLEALRRPSDGYVAGITAALARLADDRSLYARLSEGALASVRDGHLSIGRRSALLADIYAQV